MISVFRAQCTVAHIIMVCPSAERYRQYLPNKNDMLTRTGCV